MALPAGAWSVAALLVLLGDVAVAQTVEPAGAHSQALDPGPAPSAAPAPAAEPVDHVEAVPAGPSRDGRGEAERLGRPSARVLAAFDRDGDGRVHDWEVAQGAAVSFRAADRDGDGVLSGFEQGDWAAAIGEGSSVLSNPMTFDIDLDRQVRAEEFSAGLLRIAAGLKRPGEDHVALRSLHLARARDADG